MVSQTNSRIKDSAPERNGRQPEIHAAGGFSLRPLTSAEFAAGDYRPRWLIRRLLVANQPALIGGPRKSLKTSLALDLAISLGTGTPFLGEFEAGARTRTLILSGESGPHTLQETMLRICAARGVQAADVDVLWQFDLPKLADPLHRAALKLGLREHDVRVVVIDPLYLTLLSGPAASGKEAGNIFDMGPLLLDVAKSCLDAGATPILCHHTRKNLSDPHEPLDLDDLAFSGCAEFARQWLLINRRLPYEPGTGRHNLWLGAGGSCGQGGCWAVDVEEGQLGEDFSGRRWDVAVSGWRDAMQDEAAGRRQQEDAKRVARDHDDATRVLVCLDKLADAAGVAPYTQVRSAATLSGDRMTRAILNLAHEGLVEECASKSWIGKGCKTARAVKGLRRRPTIGTIGTDSDYPNGPVSRSNGQLGAQKPVKINHGRRDRRGSVGAWRVRGQDSIIHTAQKDRGPRSRRHGQGTPAKEPGGQGGTTATPEPGGASGRG